MPKVAVVGSTGMLGREVARTEFEGYEVVELNRREFPVLSSNEHFQIDSKLSNIESILNLNEVDFVINCAGMIRQKIEERDPASKSAAIEANFEIPLKLLSLSEKYNFKIVQIGTDCVFSGAKGQYIETDFHDAQDLYGRSKSLGEIPHQNLSILRASIIGLENKSSRSLLSWLISQPKNSVVQGYTDQIWNGISVFHFARFVSSIISQDKFEEYSGVHHVVPEDTVSKGTLLNLFRSAFDREDITIEFRPSGRDLNMTLSTIEPKLNNLLWNLAGYSHPLTIEEMILEYSSIIQSGG
jgi:dTDP-4-dehydrorhamnose reductase